MNTYKNVTDFFNAETPKYLEYFVDMNLAVSEQIMHYLREKNWTQKDLAKALGKNESEISKLLSGTHNFTFKSLAKIAAVIDKEIVTTPLQAKDKYKEIRYVKLGVLAKTNTPDVSYEYTRQAGVKQSTRKKKQSDKNAA